MENLLEDLSKKLEGTYIEDIENSESQQLLHLELLKISKGLDLNDVCNLIDKLYVELLSLVEQYIRCKVEMEKRQNEGNLLIAKARYIQGGKTVSVAQLPTDDSSEFNALVSTTETHTTENFSNKKMAAEKHPVDKNKGYLDPMKWFGVLVPRSLHFAKERYQLAVDLAIDAVNVQQELLAVVNYIEQLQIIKKLLKIH